MTSRIAPIVESIIQADVRRNGFHVAPKCLDERSIAVLVKAMAQDSAASVVERRGSIYAMRNVLRTDAIRELAESDGVRGLVGEVLGSDCFPVRGLYFDKTSDVNWGVPWHQDLSIAVRTRREVEGFGPWSVKAGVPHVQPPTHVLEKMLTIRLHLDHCGAENGPLRVLPGSHMGGVLSADQITMFRKTSTEVVCEVLRGGALLMRPLLLHASSAAVAAKHRRVIHLEFAAADLPGGLEWHEQRDQP